jgi:hypothetical protein
MAMNGQIPQFMTASICARVDSFLDTSKLADMKIGQQNNPTLELLSIIVDIIIFSS